MTRDKVFKLIDEERIRQENFYKEGRFRQEMHTVGAEIALIHEYVHKTQSKWSDTFGDEEALKEIVKVAALCVRALENHK